ncbi:hypothetical protein ACSFBX_22260 [Variovorax sp. RB2P76]|uniref:hypothetical protein n=1 Tax=Variovorax sp. RB2P76 TaxID=3443736 RepID=UPI003F45B0DE
MAKQRKKLEGSDKDKTTTWLQRLAYAATIMRGWVTVQESGTWKRVWHWFFDPT